MAERAPAGGVMLAAVTAGASHPAVAALLGLGAAGVAGAVVAMAWSLHGRQLRLAERLSRQQLIVTGRDGGPGQQAPAAAPAPVAAQNGQATATVAAPPAVIEGPSTIVAGEQARYRVLPASGHTTVAWAAGGGPVTHCPDPAHPGDLLLIAGEPGSLTITARVREGMTERRVTRPITAVAEVTPPIPPFPLRLFLHGWGLTAVAVLVVGFAAALDALGNLSAATFAALAVALAALLGVVTASQRGGDAPGPPRRAGTTPGRLEGR